MAAATIHGGSEACQSVGRRMPVRLRPFAGAPAPLPCCTHALTCTHAPTRANTSCPACSSAPLVVRLLHCQSRPSRASPRRLSHPCCCETLRPILYAPANGRNSFEWALHKFFGRCARPEWLRMVPAAQVIANPARHRMRALSVDSIRSYSARVPRRKLICALKRQKCRTLRALEGALARRIGSMPLFLTHPRGRGRLMWPCHARCCP